MYVKVSSTSTTSISRVTTCKTSTFIFRLSDLETLEKVGEGKVLKELEDILKRTKEDRENLHFYEHNQDEQRLATIEDNAKNELAVLGHRPLEQDKEPTEEASEAETIDRDGEVKMRKLVSRAGRLFMRKQRHI